MPQEHRKKVRSYNIPSHGHELTFSCFRRIPLLSKDRSRGWLIDALARGRKKLNFAVWAYVIMPEHVHVIVWPRESKYEIRRIRSALKIPVNRNALRYLTEQKSAFLEHLRDVQPCGEVHYRFWQRGGGYDRNIEETGTLETMIAYIHNNPVRRGLVEKPTDWVWSSARFYQGRRDVPLLMDELPSL